MKKIMRSTFGRLFNKNWMLAAILICGASVFTSCTNDSIDNPSPEQPKKNRAEFIAHTRQNLKELAENLNFSSWIGLHHLNNDFNTHVLTNPSFDKTISTLFSLAIQGSIKPVEAGSELAQLGYQNYAIVDLTAFNIRFTQNDDNTGFDAEPAEDFQIIFKRSQQEPQDGMGPEGGEKPEAPMLAPSDEYESLVLKASGTPVDMLDSRLSKENLAVIMRVPSAFEFILGTLKEDGTILARATGTFKNEFVGLGTSTFINPRTDAWNISGTLQVSADFPEQTEMPQGPGAPFGLLKDDAASFTFAIGQNPVTHEANLKFGFVHNDRNIMKLQGVMKNLNGQTDYTKFNTGMSMVEAFTAVMAGNSLEEGTITLLDDLSTTLKISDCSKVIVLQSQMASARRNYADQETIEGYVSQLNELISGTMTCQGLGQTIPMKLQTTKIGIDWWAAPALNFADENGYVTLYDMLDKESIEYGINIIDHTADPLKQSIITVRQLMQYLQTMMGNIKSNQAQQ
jgi:hypothetical protein